MKVLRQTVFISGDGNFSANRDGRDMDALQGTISFGIAMMK